MPKDETMDWMRDVIIGEIEAQPIVIENYDSAWPERFVLQCLQ